MNALKHGLRSDAILLPGDDAAEFHRLRANLFATYRPLTEEEARCVERMAGLQWRMARCARWEAIFDAKLDALLHDADGTVAERNDPDPHRWQHRGDDCERREHRLDLAMNRAEQRLFVLQKQRRNGLLPGAAKRERDPAALFAEESSAQRAAAGPGAVSPQADLQGRAETAPEHLPGAPSSDSGNGIRNERDPRPVRLPPSAPQPPPHPAARDPRYPAGIDIIPPLSYVEASHGEGPLLASVSSATAGIAFQESV